MDRERGAPGSGFDPNGEAGGGPPDPDRVAAGRCANCGAGLSGPFCSECGQEARDLDLSLRRLLGEVLGSFLNFDSRAWRTLVPLVIRPGEVTARYLKGERVRFVPPVRLYLFVSLVYFLALAWLTPGQPGFAAQGEGEQGPPPAEAGTPADTGPEAAGELARTPDGRFITHEGDTVTLSQLIGEMDEGQLEIARELVAPLVPGLEQAMRDGAAFRRAFIQGTSYLMFFLVPLFAALLHAAYLGRGYFLHHFLFALHFHVFSFLVLGVRALFDLPGWSWLSSIGGILLWVPAVYLAVALQRVHGGAVWKNVVRAAAVGFTYLLALTGGVLIVVILLLLRSAGPA